LPGLGIVVACRAISITFTRDPTPTRVREKSKFACDFSVIWVVQSSSQKYSA